MSEMPLPLHKQPATWTERMEVCLRVHGPQPLRLLCEEGMRFVPAGPAWREGYHKRKTDARWRNFGADAEIDQSDTTALVRAGAQRIVLAAIRSEVKAGRFVKFEQDGRRWVGLPASSLAPPTETL